MPVYSEMLAIENILMSNFDQKMEWVCQGNKAQYINLSLEGAKYQFTDGNHLWKRSSKEFSIALGEVLKGQSSPGQK